MDRKQIYAAMENDVIKSLNSFNTAVSDLMNATYIIVSGKISKLLQSIAQSRPLYEYMQQETAGYNFVDEFRSHQFRDEHGSPYIDVPQEDAEIIKFAFCLLFAIDTGKINIENLLHTFFYNSDANTELRRFCNEIIKPFAESVNSIFNITNPSSPAPDPIMPPLNIADKMVATDLINDAFKETFAANNARTAEQMSQSASEDDSLYLSLADVTNEIIGIAAKDNSISSLEREELLLVCDAFVAAVGYKEYKSVRVMFVALKNTLKLSSDFAAFEEKYNDLLYLVGGLGIETEE